MASPFEKIPFKLSSLVEPLKNNPQMSQIGEMLSPIFKPSVDALNSIGNQFKSAIDQYQSGETAQQSSPFQPLTNVIAPAVNPGVATSFNSTPLAMPKKTNYLDELFNKYKGMYAFSSVDFNPFDNDDKRGKGLYG